MQLIDSATKEALLDGVVRIGQDVLKIYRRGFVVDYKQDASPLTEADLHAHRAFVALLEALTPLFPVLSEESEGIDQATRRGWPRYWLIDPLDGTREFVEGNGEFTLNVALIEAGVPVFGIVHAPVPGMTWWGDLGQGAWKRQDDEPARRIQVRALPDPEQVPWKLVGSRAHGAAALDSFRAELPRHEYIAMGSSLKLCLIAEGAADLYPRFAPTCEWDTAAAQAVVTAAGGQVLNAHTLEPLRCNQQESLLNPFFVVCGQRDARWEKALRLPL